MKNKIKFLLAACCMCGILNAQTLLLSENFESGNLNTWMDCTNQITTEHVHSGKYADKYMGYPGCTKYLSKDATEVYMKMWFYFPVGFLWNTASLGGRHFWRLTNAQGSSWQFRQVDSEAPQGGFKACHINLFIGNGGSEYGHYRNITPFPEGTWFSFEYHIKLNDPGKSNGLMEVWVNGARSDLQVGYSNNIIPRIVGADFGWDYPFNMFRLNTNYDYCTSGDICYWYTDDVEIWSGCPPGSPCATATSVNEKRNNTAIQVYPNPFIESAIVDFTEIRKSPNEKLDFHLYNLLGEEIISYTNIQDDHLELKNALPAGIYLYKVMLNGEPIDSGKIIKQ